MAKRKFYVVWRGHQEGIFDSWAECKSKIDGFKGAKYKSFPTFEEAKSAFEHGSETKIASNKSRDKDVNKQHIEDLLNAGKVVIFTDGGALGNPGVGGYGVVMRFRIKDKTYLKELKKGFRETTNNRMELLGVIDALKSMKDPSKEIELFSDSKYVVDAITKKWARSWQSKGWVKSNKEKAKNIDLWEDFLSIEDSYNVNYNWVKGHAGIAENERCDELAGEAMRGDEHFIDAEYENSK